MFGEPFEQQAAAFGQAAWAVAPDMHSGPEIPPWRKPFAPPAPQQPAAQTRVDTALTRANLAETRTDLRTARELRWQRARRRHLRRRPRW